MDQLEAMQEDGDNWNQEEMLQAAVGLIALDSDLQSSGTSTSTSPPESDSDCNLIPTSCKVRPSCSGIFKTLVR